MNRFLLIRGVSALAIACSVVVVAGAMAGGCSLAADSPSSDGGAAGSGGSGGSAGAAGGSGGSAGSGPVIGPDMALPGNSGSLPFAVDTEYASSGYMGDGETANVIAMVPSKPGDDTTCSGNRASASAVGACHSVVYTPPGVSKGWGGVFWQYPANNWGTKAGYAIPSGATKIVFQAKGAKGGEKVEFVAGMAPGANPYNDTISAKYDAVLTADWASYTIDLTGQTYSQVLGAFGWTMVNTDAATAGSFFVDDIQWE